MSKINIVKSVKKDNTGVYWRSQTWNNYKSSAQLAIQESVDENSATKVYELENLTLYYDKNSFKCNITQFANCCGAYEIGSFQIMPSFPDKALLEVMDTIANFDTGTTYMCTTNGKKGTQKKLENVLAKSKMWTAVKKFKNSNSSNMVTIWISNND